MIFYLKKSRTQSQKDYKRMIFFDDVQRNINIISSLGVVSVYVRDKVSRKVIEELMQMFEGLLMCFQ